jgi:cytochrome c peroxidase
MRLARSLRLSVVLFGILSCGPKPYVFQLPSGVPAPFVPAENPMTEEKVALGRKLFYDKRLSANGTQSCASCHDQRLGFSDGKALPVGSLGDNVPRNSMTLQNVAYLYPLTWANPVLDTLEKQALVPLTADAPVELGFHKDLKMTAGSLKDDSVYQRLFAAAFPGEADPVRAELIAQALASFERTLLGFDSPFDKYNAGDDSALSDSAKRGYALFNSETAECYHCHAGFMMTLSVRTVDTVTLPREFHNNGLFNIGGSGSYPAPNTGLYEFSRDLSDMGKFRVPSLRNVTVSAPYMHDGSIPTLEAVIDHYQAGGRNVTQGPFRGDGRLSPLKSGFVRQFSLTEQERRDLISFLESLTDQSFLQSSQFGEVAQ